jgi:hypothetical protein
MRPFILRATEMPNGTLVPFVPISISQQCVQCGGARHVMETYALVDSGADRMVFPADMLTPGHGPPWDALEYAGRAYHHGSQQAYELRLWPADVSVFGVPITTAVWLNGPGTRPVYPVVGRQDLFARFSVEFHFHLSPPVFALRPASGWSADEMARPIAFAELPNVLHLEPPTGATQPALAAGRLFDNVLPVIDRERVPAHTR